jgi:hypothetical protein
LDTAQSPDYGGPAFEPDASGAGVEPGGLRSTADIKLLICYLLTSVGEPVSRALIAQILQQDGLANYFEINNAVTELLRQEHIAQVPDSGEAAYTVTPTGRHIAGTLESTLPYSVRTKAVSAAAKLLAKARHERENEVKIEKREPGGYSVTCRVLDRGTELMSVTVMVADELQASTVREIFLSDPAVAYSGVVALLTGDINPVFEAAWRARRAENPGDSDE